MTTTLTRDLSDGPAHAAHDTQRAHGGPVWDSSMLAELRAAGENLADLLEVRKAADNRARTLGHLDTELIRPPWIADAETQARQALRIVYEHAVPLHIREWAAGIPGFGSGELFPRIIAEIGDPCVASPLLPISKGDTGLGARSRPAGDPYVRSPHQLFQYCGAGDPAWLPREDVLGRAPSQSDILRAGKRTRVRPLLFTWSTSLVRMASPGKAGKPRSPAAASSPWWAMFLDRKALTSGSLTMGPDGEAGTTGRVHERECRNRVRFPAKGYNGCGTAAHPEWGEPGSPWRPGHVNMDAHRFIAKKLLLELWRVDFAARDLGPSPQTRARRDRAGTGSRTRAERAS